MADFTTNIRVTQDTYERLTDLKGEDESFDAVVRHQIRDCNAE